MRNHELHPCTIVINQKQKNLSKQERIKALIWLANTFPQAFDNSLSIKPLKLGIMNDILMYADQTANIGISKSKLREAVVIFTRRLDYLTCLKLREMRINLFGEPIELVSADDALKAAEKIKKLVEKCAKHTRKSEVSKPSAKTFKHKIPPAINKYTSQENISCYPEYPQAYNSQNSMPVVTTKVAAVTVKRKQTHLYDPSVVARLKEKLGLSRTNTENTEA